MSKLKLTVNQLHFCIIAASEPPKGGLNIKDARVVRSALKELRSFLPKSIEPPKLEKPQSGLTEEEKAEWTNKINEFNDALRAQMKEIVDVEISSSSKMYVKQSLINNKSFSFTDPESLDQLDDLAMQLGI